MSKIYAPIVLPVVLIFLIAGASCRKFLDVGLPDNREVAGKVFQHDTLAQARLNGVYTRIGGSFGFLHGQIGRYGAISSDEFYRLIPNQIDSHFLSCRVDVGNLRILEMWTLGYQYLFEINDLIEGLENSSITPALKKQLSGEAHFLRALNFYYLINAFGDVPMVLTTDYTVNDQMPRTPVQAVYAQIIEDLKEAQGQLREDYMFSDAYPVQRLRPNRFAAIALLARVYLYLGNWAEAEAAATAVIQSGMYELEPDPAKVFLGSSREAILQFASVNADLHAAEGSWYIPSGPNPRPAFILTGSLLAAFEPGDRRHAWIKKTVTSGITYYSPYKYRGHEGDPANEFNTVLRIGEQFLIRSEARAMQGKSVDAVHDLNIIRSRAGLPALNDTINALDLQVAVEQERRIELFSEWAHRWFDLKRWPARHSAGSSGLKRIEEVMSAFKPGIWRSEAALWPIPASEINRNANLKQNPGY